MICRAWTSILSYNGMLNILLYVIVIYRLKNKYMEVTSFFFLQKVREKNHQTELNVSINLRLISGLINSQVG